MTTGPRRIGKYELQERLGRGGMAEVWKALDPYLQRYVAIKFLHADLRADPDFMKRFEREAVVVASLHHPNIVQVHDFQTAQGGGDSGDLSNVAYMVMDYIEGEDLANYIRSTSRMNKFPPATYIVYLFAAIGAAIDYAHHKGMIHRDIKPANILLDKHNTLHTPLGEPILTDFGIVKLLGVSTGTLSGSWLGTPNYISPEQAHGKPGNERSDIYALGVILYEICTGVRPFQGDNPVAIIMQHITVMPTPPALINPNIPPALSEVILRSLAKDPELRFPTASAMAGALAQALNVPVPAILNTPTFQANPASGSVYQITYPPDRVPSQPSLTVSTSPSSPTPSALGNSQLPVSVNFMPGIQMTAAPATPVMSGLTPTHGTSETSSIANPVQVAGSIAPAQSPPMLTPSPIPVPRKRSRVWLIPSIVLLIILLAGTALSALYFLTRKGPDSSPPPVQIAGHVSFKSSGQTDENSSRGIEDGVEIDLQNIPAPPSGKSYFAWLLSGNQSDKNQNPTQLIRLGFGTFDHGNVHWSYQDPKRTNLLGITNRLLITEENMNSSPSNPSADHSTWIYSAEIPQASSASSDSVLTLLRNLLYEDSDLVALGIHGGIDIQLFSNTRKVQQLATQMSVDRDNKDANAVYSQIVSILIYLDGTTHIQEDVPNTTVPPSTSIAAQIPLRNLVRSQGPSEYLSRIDTQLQYIRVAPGASPELSKRAMQIDDTLSNVRKWFDKVYMDAKMLLTLALPDKAQLLQPAAQPLLDDLENQADYAFSGNAALSLIGIITIHEEIQGLPTFDISRYKP